MIENKEVRAASCLCGHTDYAPIEDEALLSLPGFVIEVIHQDVVERGYACKLAHVARVSKALAEKHDIGNGNGKKAAESEEDKTDDEPVGVLAG